MLDQAILDIAAAHAPEQRRRCWTCNHEIWVPGHPAFPPDPAEGEYHGCRAHCDMSENGEGCPEWQPALATPTYEKAR